MKKKLLFILLLPIFVLLLAGCGEKKDNRKSIRLVDPVFGYETAFKYNPEENYSEPKYEEGGLYKEITFENKDLDVEFQMYYTKMSKTSYDKTKETRANQKYYKEYKFGKYEAYAYGESSSRLNLNILIGVDGYKDAHILFVAIDRIDSNEKVVVADVLDKKLNDFFNSIEIYEVDA